MQTDYIQRYWKQLTNINFVSNAWNQKSYHMILTSFIKLLEELHLNHNWTCFDTNINNGTTNMKWVAAPNKPLNHAPNLDGDSCEHCKQRLFVNFCPFV